MRTAWTALAGVDNPVVQAPMGGGATTPALVAAVSAAGGLGTLAAAYARPDDVRAAARAVRALTRAPFGVNLFVPVPSSPPADDAAARAHLAPIHRELGLPAPAMPEQVTDDFDASFAACLDCGASVLSFTFGRLPRDAIAAAHAAGMKVVGTATTVDEAVLLERDGVDAVVAQGSEAGAHRGTFAVPFEDALIGTVALVPQVVDAVRIPVLASGGIVDGRGMAAALALGAAGVQLGTAFLVCPESGIPAAYREALAHAHAHETRVTRVFSGRPARGIVNAFMRDTPEDSPAVLPYPYQNALTRAMRGAAAKANAAGRLSLWAGQGAPLARVMPAGVLVATLVEETAAASARLAATAGTVR